MKKYFMSLLFFAAGLPWLFSQQAGGLPVKTAVLFTNGVGYFSREGRVSGSGSVELRFDVRDINDLLKSMVVRDLDGGRITGVNYSSREPLPRALSGFSLNLAGNPGIPQLIQQARGEKVEISADKKYAGTILGAEERIEREYRNRNEDFSETPQIYINIYGDEGMQSIALKSISGIQFQNPRLREELAAALKLISESRNTEKKSVFISYDGAGERRIQAGYIAETPVWKTSYRLVVDAAQTGGGRSGHLLQGWGIVENTTGEDWKAVRLELISGMPVSFAMDLYQPLFNPRPFVPYTLQKNLNSQTYNQGFTARKAAGVEDRRPYGDMEVAEMKAAEEAAASDSLLWENLSSAPAPNIAQSAPAAAAGDAVGEFFRYTIENPVDLPRGQSAMIPLLNEEIEAERLSIYNETAHSKHPMNGLRLKNTSKLNLMGGPITIYESGVYAGDARMDNLAPGAERLVSYSLDLSTEIMTQSSAAPEEITSIRLQRGLLSLTKTFRKERVYTLISRAAGPRVILVEHPVSAGWELVKTITPEERTAGVYRFRLETNAEKGSQTVLVVSEERAAEQMLALSNMNSDAILIYTNTNQKNISPAVRAALEKLASLKNELAGLTRQRQTAETRAAAIHREQERIRGNMDSLDRTSSLYQRYVNTLNEQENTLTDLSAAADKLRVQEAEKKKAIDDYLAELEVG
ncbi:MAG: DUF4139 domain-containing protein [Spirochaetales bacterium]|jgi:hypothetical protein|nr:DUF4139 domain-containing protein [Spirochaetales bacterium]